jgi:2-(1,2-epoxy-1,2-dihydrophenyl)acetyl-CoA isomerase
MMMLDQRVPAQQAEAWGMILRCVDDEALPVVALELARELAAKSLPAVVATRQAVLVAAADGISQALEVEAQAQRALGFSADFAEGTSAFFARRPAHFQDL